MSRAERTPSSKPSNERRRSSRFFLIMPREKLGPTLVFYDVIPVETFDTPELMRRRLQVMTRFVEEVEMNPVKSVLAGAKNCMEGI